MFSLPRRGGGSNDKENTLAGILQEDHSARLPDIVAPTLIIAGDQDPFFGPSEQHVLDTLISDATLALYPQAGHTVHVEQPDAVVETIRAFVQQRLW